MATTASPRGRHQHRAEVRPAVRGTTALAWAVLVAAVLEVVAPIVTALGPGASAGEGVGEQLLITPVGWAFSIWGVIYTLAIAQAIVVLVRGAHAVPRRLQIGQLVLYLGGTVWIAMSAIESSLATAISLAVMLLGAMVALFAAERGVIEGVWLRRLTRLAVGLFAGWVSAAFFLNVSTALVESGVVGPTDAGWQIGVLVVALVALVGVLVLSGGPPAYAAAGVWAFVGIAVAGSDNDTTAVLVTGVIGALVLVAVTAALRLRGRQRREVTSG